MPSGASCVCSSQFCTHYLLRSRYSIQYVRLCIINHVFSCRVRVKLDRALHYFVTTFFLNFGPFVALPSHKSIQLLLLAINTKCVRHIDRVQRSCQMELRSRKQAPVRKPCWTLTCRPFADFVEYSLPSSRWPWIRRCECFPSPACRLAEDASATVPCLNPDPGLPEHS